MITNVLMAALVAASTLATARMEFPPAFEPAGERIEIKGFGGRNKGDWRLASPSGDSYSGKFTRNESRLGILDPLYVRNKGKSSFTFVDATGHKIVEAECSFRKGTVNVDVVTIDTSKLAYQCELTGDSDQFLAFTLGQPKREGMKQKFLAQDLRRGEARLFDQALTIESVHSYAGSPLSSQPPVGYVLMSGDEYVGALELTDKNPGVYMAQDLTPTMERAVLVASLALSVLRDPAHSALED